MPYIPDQKKREKITHLVKHLVEELECKGDLNYAITRLAVLYTAGQKTVNYDILSDTVGVLGDAQAEFRLRCMDPYEYIKRTTNGDVYDEVLVRIPW